MQCEGHLSIGGIWRGASIIGGSRTHKLMSKFSINFRSTFHSFNERAAIAIKSSSTMAFILASFLSLSFLLTPLFIPLQRVHLFRPEACIVHWELSQNPWSFIYTIYSKSVSTKQSNFVCPCVRMSVYRCLHLLVPQFLRYLEVNEVFAWRLGLILKIVLLISAFQSEYWNNQRI